jgi:hypothetical protein
MSQRETMARAVLPALCLAIAVPAALGAEPHAAARTPLFGDLHVHTRYSFDAFLFGTRTRPDDAYRFAKGEPLAHPGGFDIQLDRPLDFYAVTDHSNYLGVWSAIDDPGHPLHDDEGAAPYLDPKRPTSLGGASAFLRQHPDPAATRAAWEDTVAAAERHNTPGRFTTFIAFEYTASRNAGNLHRNVFYRDQSAAALPYSTLDSQNPEDLWDWMDRNRDGGFDAIAIPHNSNGSDGWMFQMVRYDGSPIDRAYAEQRMRNEPLVEITQIKGTSDTHPALSPEDEWGNFEIMPNRVASRLYSQPNGSYVRQAWLRGLELEATAQANPYRFGVAAASDTHNSGDVLDEARFVSKVGLRDDEPVERGSVPVVVQNGVPAYREAGGRYFSASGLAGVWAEENTRGSIFEAFRRKETFATTGPRIPVRFFASFAFPADALSRPDLIDGAYAHGVPMGGDLVARGDAAPKFLVWAMQDPKGTKLQRAQVIKGWLDASGRPRERVYDVACSDGLAVDARTHRCPDNGATVDVADCSITQDKGASELVTLWSDPDYDPRQRAFYYVRVLENPTCRWSTWDAVRAGTAPRPDLQATIQERAWSSPIWLVPG